VFIHANLKKQKEQDTRIPPEFHLNSIDTKYGYSSWPAERENSLAAGYKHSTVVQVIRAMLTSDEDTRRRSRRVTIIRCVTSAEFLREIEEKDRNKHNKRKGVAVQLQEVNEKKVQCLELKF
jgi:hypothetical protein